MDDGYVAVHETGNKLPTYVEIVAGACLPAQPILTRLRFSAFHWLLDVVRTNVVLYESASATHTVQFATFY